MADPKTDTNTLAALVPLSERQRLLDQRLTGVATELYQLEIAEKAGDAISKERKATLTEALKELNAENEKLKKEAGGE